MPEIISENVSISLLKANEAIAKELRDFFNKKKIFVINMLSSPGSGKTTLIEKLAHYFEKEKICVLVGDVQTERDAQRLRKAKIRAFQIVTQGVCHLEAIMIKQALSLIPEDTEYLFIENVGNLVCPASYNLGEHLRIVIISTPEGDDKILKYPKAFLTADAIIINKTDLLPYLSFDSEKVKQDIFKIKKELIIFFISALKNEGIKEVVDFIKNAKEKIMK